MLLHLDILLSYHNLCKRLFIVFKGFGTFIENELPGAGTVIQLVRLLLLTAASQVGVSIGIQAVLLAFQLPAYTFWKGEDPGPLPPTWETYIDSTGSWFHAGPHKAVVATWVVKQEMLDSFSLSLSSLPVSHLNK